MLFHYSMEEKSHGLTITGNSYHQIIHGEKNKMCFKKDKRVNKFASTEQSDLQILKEIEDWGFVKVTKHGSDKVNARISKSSLCGWKKRSIFCDLPY